MTTIIIILIIFFTMVLIAAPIIYFQTRTTFREQKNYERGLKMVPLYIHLPPVSEDVEGGNRDERDVVQETISKAEIIYSIIGSTFEKGLKRNFYGQRHFAFEIVGNKGMIHFYAAVPISMLEVVKQAILSAYPSARLEEAAEHNIFNPVGKASGTLGGEFSLKQHYAYPIATFEDLKRDAMQSLLSALASLTKEDGAGIQILMRPADPEWRKKAVDMAKNKRKGGGGLSPMELLKSVPGAMVKPPDTNSSGESKKPELSSLESSTYDAIDDKTRHVGYEVVIRVVTSSNVVQRSQAILNNIVASFGLYDAPGKNGFKFTPAKDVEGLVTSYLMRFFPQQHNSTILNSVELATIFHFPDERSIPTASLMRQDSKQVDGPPNMPDKGLLLGYNVYRGVKKPIRVDLIDRQRHMYIAGQTGTGKSTMLENLALQDMLSGNGFAFVDPHGDTTEKILSMVPKERTEDVIYFCPADMDYPLGLNLFEFKNPDQKDFLVQESLNMLRKLYDPNNQGFMGPRYDHIFRNAALTVMADPNGGTIIDIPKLLRDQNFLSQKLQYVTDPTVRDFWLKEMAAARKSNEFGDLLSWFQSKFGAFLSNDMMRNIIGQTKSAFDLRDIMDNKKILLVNLSKGKTGDLNSKLLGMIFVMKFQAAAMSRADVPEDQRADFCLYVDEFQNFATDSFATIMSEARKYHLNLIVANQFMTQLEEEIRDAVFGNIGSVICFRIGQNDAETLGKYFQPTFDTEDLLRIPNHNTVVRSMVNGVPTQPFSMATLPPLGTSNPKLLDALKQLSAAKYGRPRAIVEQEFTQRMQIEASASVPGTPAINRGANPVAAVTPGTALPPQMPQTASAAAPAYNSPFSTPNASSPGPSNGAPTAPTSPPSSKPKSFLDEWLERRKKLDTQPTGPSPATAQPAAANNTGPSLNPPAAATADSSLSQPWSPPGNYAQTAPPRGNIQDVWPGPVAGSKPKEKMHDQKKWMPKHVPAPHKKPVKKATPKPKAASPKPAITKPKPAPTPAPANPVKTESKPPKIDINAVKPPKPVDNDTIVIDEDGTFRIKQDQE